MLDHRGKHNDFCLSIFWVFTLPCNISPSQAMMYQIAMNHDLTLHHVMLFIHRRKFRSQTSDNMDRWKAEQGRGREKRKIRRKKSQKKEDADARKGRKVAKHGVFPMICGSGGSKSRLAKVAGAEPAGQMRHEKLHAVVAQSTCASQNA